MGKSNLRSTDVSDFYNEFPYPSDPILDEIPNHFDWRLSIEDVFSYCTGALLPDNNSSDKLRILDAGCGTGLSTNYLAHQNPRAEILAIDISEVAINIAQERLTRSSALGKASVFIKQKSLDQIHSKNKFHYINSFGVLQHLPDPSSSLNKLSSLMKEGAILHVNTYSKKARRDIKEAQKVFHTLGIDATKDNIILARDFLSSLPEENYLRRTYYSHDMYKDDYKFADAYLHPLDNSFSLEAIFAMVKEAELEFLGFSNPKEWVLENFLKDELLQKAKKLSPLKQLQLVEAIDQKTSCFDFFLGKPPIQKYEWTSQKDILDTSAKISRFIFGSSEDNLCNSLIGQTQLSERERQFIEVLSKNSGNPLHSLPLPWPKGQIASTARVLNKKQLLLFYPL